MRILSLTLSLLTVRGAFALTSFSYLPPESLPEGICQVRFQNYEFKPYNGKTPRLGVLACTASFLNRRKLLMSGHCHLDIGYYRDDRDVEVSRRLDAQTIDIACAKKQILHRDLEVKKRHHPDSFESSPDWNISDPDLMIVELRNDFPSEIEPLEISEESALNAKYLDVFGYGRTESPSGGIALLGEPLNLFRDEVERAHYHRTPTDLYKGTRITEFREIGLGPLIALADQDSSYPTRLGPILLAHPDRVIRSFLELLFYPEIKNDRDNTPIKLGDSGGPVLDPSGRIIAINTMATHHRDADELHKLRGYSIRLTGELRAWIRRVLDH